MSEFIPLLLSHQSRLYGYNLTLVPQRQHVDEILQQTNVVLLRKAEEFAPGTNFAAWAFRIANYEIMQQRRHHQRQRLSFDDTLLASLAAVAEAEDERFLERQRYLRECLDEMSERYRDVVRRRYLLGSDLTKLATELNLSGNALKQLLFRAREALRACINTKMEARP